MNDTLTGPPDFIKLLAPEIRWQIIKTLQFSDHRVQELVDLLQQPKNLLSYHLKQLRDEALVTYRRSDADRRDYYYSLNVPHLQTLYQQTGEELHLASLGEATTPSYHWTSPVRVLYLCTRNSARSQMAEGLLRTLPDSIRLQAGDLQVLLVHGSPRKVNEYLYEDRPESSLERILDNAAADILICGHTHLPYHRILSSGRHVVNAGSVGKPKDANPQACYLSLSVQGKQLAVEFIRIPYDVEKIASAIEASEMPSPFAQMLREGRG